LAASVLAAFFIVLDCGVIVRRLKREFCFVSISRVYRPIGGWIGSGKSRFPRGMTERKARAKAKTKAKARAKNKAKAKAGLSAALLAMKLRSR
jgi:hypothetical protein